MTILATIFLTCAGLLATGVILILFEQTNPSQPSIFPKVVMWLTVATMVVTFISIITIGIYTGDIKEWASIW